MAEGHDDKALWSRQWEIFHAALERPANERQDFLVEVCPSAELHRAVEELLAVHEAGSGPLDPSQQDTLLRRAFDPLPAGRVLARRFEIQGLLGQGGMGSVYEAHDRQLDSSVALKMLHPETSGSSVAHQRFLREIQLARQVTHPNVCRIFDLFQDGELNFLTMELLRGDTLRQWIVNSGPLSTENALPLVEQICAGMAAAHEVGIIHRDLKTANIMLVEGSDSARAVITDFGLARSPAPEVKGSDQLTAPGQILGTPAYMAPEQFDGGEISPLTDIYSLGVVLFELVTGELPFAGETPYSIAARRLRQEAPSPRRHLPTLDRPWERLILRCLERDPRDRPRDTEEIVATLRGEAVPVHWPPRRRKRWAAVLSVAVLLAVAALLLAPWSLPRGSSTASEAMALAKRDWLLIADFDNRTGEKVLEGTLEAALERDLVNSSFVNVASTERVGDTLKLMAKPADSRIHATLAREVALRDGAIRAVVDGSVERLGSKYLLSVDLINPRDGVVLAALSEEAAGLEGILPTVRKLSLQVRESLGEVLPTLPKTDESLSRVSTSSLRALQLYSQADRLLSELTVDRPDTNKGAEELLREAIAEDPAFASSHTHLAWALRRQRQPVEEYLPHAERALELAESATVVERYFIRGSYYSMRSSFSGSKPDLEMALSQYQALLQLDPGHHLAVNDALNALRGLGRGRESLELSLRLVDSRPSDVATLSRAARQLVVTRGDLEEARVYVRKAQQLQSELPNEVKRLDPFLEFFPVQELWVSGDVEGVMREVDTIAESLDGLSAAARADLAWGAVEYYCDLGMFEKAEALQTLHAFMGTGQWAWVMAFRRGDLDIMREAMRWQSRSGDLRLIAMSAFILAQAGYPAEAEQYLEQLPEAFDLEPGFVLGARGSIHFAGQRYEDAVALLEEALPFLRYESYLVPYFAVVRTLSQAWEALGQPQRGLPVLEEAARLKPRVLSGRSYWMESQLRLAEIYHIVGRDKEALVIETEVRRYCAYADPDFPVLRGLEEDARVISAPNG